MPYCPKCRKSFSEGAFCPDCHARLVKDEPKTSASSASPVAPCPACGSLSSAPGSAVRRVCNSP